MSTRRWIVVPALIALIVALGLSSCVQRDEGPAPVTVATMIDSEGAILGKAIVLLLEDGGVKTVDRTEFGTPDILRKALEAGEVPLTVDYTGSGQYYHEGYDPSIWNDPERGYEMTRRLDQEANDIHWLAPAPANNTEALAVTRAFSEETGIRDMAGFADYVNSGGEVKLICAQSFADNPLGLIGLELAYGFKLRPDQLILLSSGNTAEMLKALSEGTSGVNVSLVYGTDGALDALQLLVLDDPRHVPPVYQPAAVVRGDALRDWPDIPSILEPFFARLELETLQALNAQVSYEGKDPREVAQKFLVAQGLLDE
ncbi:MAG TPA: glycine betaine ABC transporter substrate-binding protein [Spirochaetales bacterium]|nr:glycine betaine ABC transporter substrate-binding protein [Spirochaetales bacterium]